MKKIVSFFLVFSMLICLLPTSVHADTVNSSPATQYIKLTVDNNDKIQLINVSEEEFQNWYSKRSATYTEGWTVYSLTGSVAAYVSLYYQTVTSSGKQVFDLSNSYFGVNPQNGYIGSLTFLSSSVHSLNMKYEFSNLLGDSGYRTHTFYPQQ